MTSEEKVKEYIKRAKTILIDIIINDKSNSVLDMSIYDFCDHNIILIAQMLQKEDHFNNKNS